jgi:hypothetical protein
LGASYARQAIRPAEALGSPGNVSSGQGISDTAAADPGALTNERGDNVHGEALPCPEAAQGMNITLAPVPEGKIGTGPQLDHAQVPDQGSSEIGSGRMGSLQCELRYHKYVEVQRRHQRSPFFDSCQEWGGLSAQHGQRMGIESIRHSQPARCVGGFRHLPQKTLVSTMNTVEDTDRHTRVRYGMEERDITEDAHRVYVSGTENTFDGRQRLLM